MSLDPEQVRRSERTHEVRRAYGCSAEDARELVAGQTRFAAAVQYFGPMFCWYSKRRRYWTLFGKPRQRPQIVRLAKFHAAKRAAA